MEKTMTTKRARIRGVIFDMDGVLVSSEDYMVYCAQTALADYGVFPVKEDFEPFVGSGEDLFVGGVAEKYGVPYQIAMKERTYEIYIERASEGVKLFTGIPQMFSELFGLGYKLGIASSADEIKVRANIRVAGIPENTISALLTGSHVKRKKPFPDIFLASAEKLALDPSECLVVEDAINGIQAAKEAGMMSVGVLGSFTEEALRQAGADHVVANTSDIVAWLKRPL